MGRVHQGLRVCTSVHPGKANIVADALSRKPRRRLAALRCSLYRDLMTLSEFDFRPQIGGCIALFGTIMVQSSWIARVVDADRGLVDSGLSMRVNSRARFKLDSK